MNNIFLSVPLGEVLTERLEVPSEEAISNGEIPLIAKIMFDSGNIQLRIDVQTKTSMILIRPGDLVVSGINAAKGAIAIYGEENTKPIAATIHYCAYFPNKNRVDSSYLWRLLRSHLFRDLLFEHVPGGIKTELKAKRLLPIPIPLPSLKEQQRIVARIEELAAGIEEARGLRREAADEKKKILPSTVTQLLTSILDEAKEVTIESIAYSVTDGDHQPPPKADSGIPFIFINHIIKGKIDFSDCKWVPPEYFASISDNRVPKRGDVLYTAVGSYGVPCLVDTDEPFCFQRHIAIIRPNQSRIVPAYLTWALSSSNVFEQATKAATGSAQLTVPLRGIRNLKIPLPTLQKQQQIVAYLNSLKSNVDSLEQLQKETSAELDALLPSILDKAFKGEL
jgi:type I restriction enzyme, S subunit